MSAAAAQARGVTPLARIIGWASAGVDPRCMGIGPVPAVQKLLAKTGLSLDDFDLVELNEAFAAAGPRRAARTCRSRSEKLNVNGGAIALGHPIGCTGTRIVVTLLYEMLRREAQRGLATLCVSGGMGMAMAIEADARARAAISARTLSARIVARDRVCGRSARWQMVSWRAVCDIAVIPATGSAGKSPRKR